MTRRLDVQSRHREQIERLLREHLPAVEVWAYGSRVNGQSHAGSDLDLVLRSPGLVEIDSSQLAEFNEAVQESTIPFLIEARDWARLPESFHREIEREYVVLEKEKRSADSEWRETVYGPVRSDFAESRLANLCAPTTGIQTGPFGSQLHQKDYVSVGTPIITVEHLGENRILHDALPCVSEQDRSRLSKYSLQKGDIVFSRVGSVDRRALVRTEEAGWLFSGRCLRIRPNPHKIDAEFLSYFFGSSSFKNHVRAIAVGATMPSLNTQLLSDIRVPHPTDINEQRAIAHILGSLDDKIELNRRMNETLEEMARALFKSWFIDFDPVHAKAALKRPSPPLITPPLRGSRQAKGDSPQARRWGVVRRSYTQHAQQKARSLRENQTDAEGLLWHYLRHKQLDGHKFRRQQPIGPYIVDFACMPRKVIVELDGGQHAERRTHDERRDRFLQGQGYRLLRFWNNEVFENCFGVLERIYEAVQNPPPPQPAPGGLASATPPQGGSDRTGKKAWTVERARAYLDRMDPSIAALFPDCFVDSELGEVPAGWGVKALGEVVETVKGRSYRRKELIESDTALVTLKSFARGGGYRPDGLKSFAGTYREDQVVHSGEIVIACTDVTQAADVIGRPAIVQATTAYRTLVASLDTLIVRPSRKCMTRTFLYFLTISDEFVAHTYAHTTGTTVLHLVKNAVPSYCFIQPPTQLVQYFDDVAKSLLERIQTAQKESEFLTVLRDTLLPKLVSGEVRIPEAEKLETSL